MSLAALFKPKRRQEPAPPPDDEGGLATSPASGDQPLEVYLAEPAGNREGPFSLDQLNQELAAGKYRTGDYWAWHKGLDEWVPLYDIKGIIKVSTPAVASATVAGSDSVPASPDISMPALTNSTEPMTQVRGSEEQLPGDVQDEVPEVCAHTQPDALPLGDCPKAEPSTPVTNAGPLELAPADQLCIEAATTNEQEPEDAATVSQMPAEPEAELEAVPPDEPFEGAVLPANSVIQDGPAPDSLQVPAEPAEPLPADETPYLPATDADEPPGDAETPTAILARLKKSFFQTPEPSNEATCYFNAGRAITPQSAEASATTSADEWALSDAAQSQELQSSGLTEAPAPGSSAQAEEDPQVALLAQEFSSGMPFAALEHIFVFTTGDGQSVWSSPIVRRMLEAVVGEKLDRIRQSTPRDVIFNCDLSQLLKRNGAISDSVWRAMAIREPSVVARAQQKLSCTCVRTFRLETGTVVALILHYNNQKLNPGAASPEPGFRGGPLALPASPALPDFPLSR